MQHLSVDASALVDNCNWGKITLVLQEDGFLSNKQDTDLTFVAYSQIQKYGTSIRKNANVSTTYLYVRYNVSSNSLVSQKNIHLSFGCERNLVAVLEILLDYVDVDPHHHHDAFGKLKTDIYDTSTPFERDEWLTSTIATSFVKTHVTFLQFVGNLILAGVGDHLQIYTKDSKHRWKCLLTRQVFQGQHIHGIRLSSDAYMVVYGGREVSLFKFRKSRIRFLYSFQAPDWVLDCKWLKGNEVTLLTANNALVHCNLFIHKPVVNRLHYCVERCILYSGKILGDSWDDVIVLAGTVFSTIAIWSNSGNSRDKEIIHRLEGHKGVIFSVEFCHRNKRICSTSDDRTVRVWDVAFENCDWAKCAITLKFTLYGHSARVWKSALLESGQIVSIGEDSRICLWSSGGSLENHFRGHQDGEVWSLDVSEELQLIATGGSDGGVNLWPMKKVEVPHELKCPFENVKPKCVGLSAKGRPFMVCWQGNIFLYNDSWELCLSEPELKSYCLHAVSPDRLCLAFASINGQLLICRLEADTLKKVAVMNVCDGRIYSLMWVSSCSIVICGSSGEFSIWKLSDADILTKEADFILPHSKERWVTSCSADSNYVVCGDRCGSLHLYRREAQNPLYTTKKIHGQNGVTDVKFLDGKFVSTGRDGTYREFVVESNKLVMLRCCKLKMDWAAAVHDSALLGRVLFCFHETSFVIWNVQNRQEIVKTDCGGGHRSWDCMVNQKSIVITFIKGSSVNYCCTPIGDILCQPLLRGNHPKAINCGDLVGLSGKAPDQLILLGGEDTTLRLVSVDDDQTELCVLQRHLSSVRAVACHKSSDDCIYVASGGGRGQLVLWKVSQNKNDVDVIELTSHSVLPETNESNDAAEMRIMDLQVYQPMSASVLIAAGCSDGMLRIFNCSESDSITEVQAVECQNCLLKVRCHIGTKNFLIATTTCGNLFFYSISSSGLLSNTETDQKFLVSNTGINSCDTCEVGGRLIVACAGDDAIVNILLFDKNFNDNRLQLTDKWVYNAAHTCQVSGLSIIDDLVLTVGLDQKLTVFAWGISGNQIRAEIINTFELCIPDIHGVLAWPRCEKKSYNILVYGLGTQLITFSVTN